MKNKKSGFWTIRQNLHDKEDYGNEDKERLKNIIEKNFQTCMIGALSDFELDFGYIWGVEELIFEMPYDDSENEDIAKKIAKSKCPKGWTPDLKFSSKNSFFIEDDKNLAVTIIRKDKKNLTKDEQKAREIWEDVRCSILDRGNNKKRETLKEIDNHHIKWKRYNYNFNIGDQNGY